MPPTRAVFRNEVIGDSFRSVVGQWVALAEPTITAFGPRFWRKRSPAAAADSMAPVEVRAWPFTVAAKGTGFGPPRFVQEGTQAPLTRPWPLQKTKKPWSRTLYVPWFPPGIARTTWSCGNVFGG